ncbi:hypothetical protein MEN41_04345 [Dolichospermum sp. ST_con]|nr:hypothetical protein [Dolichospermum sp. ST_con]MDD1420765.1 hypothetical protein [Dolichospermum sp. ST_sed1]MDD1426267.1 hypothetical protein [Dolichospermum sp. ST_sed9]MDD1432763.1 hypothetical protein [Dolichospermum sp. ST_sed6]MDD1439685.1 hypothetical protein [Dolichospermum sp. ST_sed3]MDD1447917.1 hypothetical protein [Dolichospermum sp. ST_sed8]MDD1455818.1 hypothetical protein [Dolichospermum sp. ST_sed7]MDD1461991.1 hypothetical protein [Dolichospermum sp. ST_sed2]MDD1468011
MGKAHTNMDEKAIPTERFAIAPSTSQKSDSYGALRYRTPTSPNSDSYGALRYRPPTSQKRFLRSASLSLSHTPNSDRTQKTANILSVSFS